MRRIIQYIHQRSDWPYFTYNHSQFVQPLALVRHRQGRLLGRMESLGFSVREKTVLETLTQDVIKSSEIEGENLEIEQVRSSIARRLGVSIGGLVASERNIDGIVEMTLDAMEHYNAALTVERLFGWQSALFPSGYSGIRTITVGAWRKSKSDPMQVVSGAIGRERIHFEAPTGNRIKKEMTVFLKWFNTCTNIDPVLKAGIAHLWFVTIHPFEDGNGRIARVLADMQLARADKTPQRFYSMSSQIRHERNTYYSMLEKTQKGNLDITPWLLWFLDCLGRAITASEIALQKIFEKTQFWDTHKQTPLNHRQRIMLNKLLDGFDGKLTSSKWAKIAKCSPDTALRDIHDLLQKKILAKEKSGGRSTTYVGIFK